ncbi:MAG: hypothetical protein ACTHMD_05430 [Flavisolibacter sp.]
MEAVIKVKVSELNASLLKRIKKLFSEKEDAEITISLGKALPEYLETLIRSKNDLENNRNLISFTMEELEEYTAKQKA